MQSVLATPKEIVANPEDMKSVFATPEATKHNSKAEHKLVPIQDSVAE